MSTFASPSVTYCVAAIQYEPTLGEKEKNICDLLALVEDAASHGARLIVLPELATTGCSWISREDIAPYTESVPGPTTQRFQHLATAYSCYIVVGLPEIDPQLQIFYNSAVLIGPEGVIGVYRKIHASIGDPRWARDGDLGVLIWETPLGRIGIMIGTDTQYFETARLAALKGADILVLPANCSDEKCPSSWWMARAFENGVYLIAANRGGSERGTQFSGGSCIINPDGTVQKFLDDDQGIAYGEVTTLPQNPERTWQFDEEVEGYPLADRRPGEYLPLLSNNYLWEPLRYHSLYTPHQLPPGQLSCVGIVQMPLTSQTASSSEEIIGELYQLLQISLRDNAPALPDVVVLPSLLLPGPMPAEVGQQQGSSRSPNSADQIRQHFQNGAIEVPGPETAALVRMATQLQISIVLGVAERFQNRYYNTVLLLDPEGVYGIYRKIHLSPHDRLWAEPGDCGFPVFDLPAGRVGLSTGYDLLFPETLRILAAKGADLVCAPALLDFSIPMGLSPSAPTSRFSSEEHENMRGGRTEASLVRRSPLQFIWRVRAAEHNVYLAIANWSGEYNNLQCSGLSGIFSPSLNAYPLPEIVAEDDETGLMMMTIDTREQRTGRRTSKIVDFSPGDMAGSLTGELAYNVFDTIPGNMVRSKPFLRKRQLFWYKDLVRESSQT
jgi:predicted amidohydrolase